MKARDSMRNRDIGLPAMLSVAGLLVTVLIAALAGLENWLDDDGDAGASAVAVAGAEQGVDDLYRERELVDLRALVDTLEIRIEQLTATGERLERRLDDLEDQLGPVTASAAPRAFTQSVAAVGKSDRASVHLPVAPPAVTAAAAPAAPTRTLFALELPTYRTIAQLSAGWEGIRRRGGGFVAGLEPRAYAVRDARVGIAYRLLAGPIRNAGEAASRCVRLNDIGIPCDTTVFAGERLPDAASN